MGSLISMEQACILSTIIPPFSLVEPDMQQVLPSKLVPVLVLCWLCDWFMGIWQFSRKDWKKESVISDNSWILFLWAWLHTSP